ncbi:flavodoxin family protein [Caproiciproducens galactitolivorans]|uniref:2-amino-4-deoxychorismate dehydrogenase n=1 Tax=Caproiciproducens galactitolivorans TaxID=642589 RepID=A0A4Z0Y7M4_9FIRM|nr:flavodoxin family protein [Caproiciproducens galactitolivorans]QEY33830.1 flavodoxin family protein [Caproiciproducens galactitolivorans]TGJ75525.1 2-amino-4-deoxychorismate dehydrogenase [Caproiciproducens galactitolivorans]
MKVLAINGSPHEQGCTYTAIRLVADELEKQGIETEIVQVGKLPVRSCIGCRACKEGKRCVFDDIVNECIDKSKDADGILLGSPVYYSGIAGSMKCFLDRFFYAGPYLHYKVGAAVVSARRAGTVETFQQLNNYFNLRNIVIAPSHYWNEVHGSNAEDVMKDEEGVQIMRTLGRNMAWLLKMMEYGKNAVPLPEQEEVIHTNFIR